jgi:hypothetical protein
VELILFFTTQKIEIAGLCVAGATCAIKNKLRYFFKNIVYCSVVLIFFIMFSLYHNIIIL